MSALVGVWRKDGAPPIESALDAMERAISDWQCDTRGAWCDGDIGLGNRLLYTTPESHYERVPFTHPAFPHLVLSADAWLDNRDALCDAFGIPPAARATTCDGELILRAYAQWGEVCAAKLRGDFAFALWDAQRRQWYCARDFVGAKPLLYFDSPQLFSFASDIRAVLACPGVPNALDEVMLAAYLSMQSTVAAEQRRTFYQDIFKIPPAHFLVVTRDTARLTRYWSPDDAPAVCLASPDGYAERTRELLERAVQNSIRTPYRVGAHLSGGLDSTAIAILAARGQPARNGRLNGYSWSPPPSRAPIQDEADERSFIEIVCAQENITPRYLEYSHADAAAVYRRDVTRIPREMALREEQVEDAAARDNVRVLLSGWGGDELLSYSGRGYLAELFLSRRWGELERQVKRRLPPSARGARRLRAYGGIVYDQMLWMLMPDWVWRLHSPYPPQTFHAEYMEPEFFRQRRAAVLALRDPLPRDYPNVRVTQTTRLEHGHLTRRMESWTMHGARRGIVYRYPLLAQELVEFVLGLPPHLYFDAGRSRAVLRRATRGILPEPLRATRTKDEPTAIGIIMDAQAGGARALYEQTRPQFTNHPATRYVNVRAIEAAFTSPTFKPLQAVALMFALSCFYIPALAARQ